MKRYYFILLILFYFHANGQISYFGNNVVPQSTDITSLSPGILSLINHMQLAKDAPVVSEGTAIDSVQDQSGHNNTIVSTGSGKPLQYSTRCNGTPAWYFDGTDDFFNITTYTTRGAICVVNVDSTRSSFALLEGFYGSRSTGGANSYWGTDGGTGLSDFSPSGNATYMNAGKITTANNFFYPTGKSFRVIAMTTSTGVTDATGYQVGSDRKFGTRWLKGNYAAIIGLSGIPSKKQLDTITAFLWYKCNIERPINFVQDGNSIGVGVGAYVRDSIQPCTYRNFSVGGQTTFDRYQAAPTAVDTCYGFPYGTKQVCFLLEGTNDLINKTADSAYYHMMAYANARIAVGWKVVISTVLSRDTTLNAGYESRRVALNSLITATTQTNSLKIVNFGQDSNLGDPLAYQNTTYFADGIHPAAAGYKLIAKYAALIIKSFTW